MLVEVSDCDFRAQPPLSQEEPCSRERAGWLEITGRIETEADLKPCHLRFLLSHWLPGSQPLLLR